MSMMRKGFGNEPLKDITMEMVRVKEFEESLREDFSLEALYISWV